MFFLLILLVSLVLLVVVMLASPVRFTVTIDTSATKRVHTKVNWFYGLLNFELKDYRKTPKKTKQAAVKSRTISKRRFSKITRKKVKFLLPSKGFKRRIFRFLLDFIKTINLSVSYFKLGFGLNDPAETGKLYALLFPLSIWLKQHGIKQTELIPHYMDYAFYLKSEINIQFVPLKQLGLIMQFLISPVIWQEFYRMLKASEK